VPDDPKRPFHNPFGALSHLPALLSARGVKKVTMAV